MRVVCVKSFIGQSTDLKNRIPGSHPVKDVIYTVRGESTVNNFLCYSLMEFPAKAWFNAVFFRPLEPTDLLFESDAELFENVLSNSLELIGHDSI